MQPIDVVFLAFLLSAGFFCISWFCYQVGKDNGAEAEQNKWIKAARKGKPRRINREHTLTHEYNVVYLGEKEEVAAEPASDTTVPNVEG